MRTQNFLFSLVLLFVSIPFAIGGMIAVFRYYTLKCCSICKLWVPGSGLRDGGCKYCNPSVKDEIVNNAPKLIGGLLGFIVGGPGGTIGGKLIEQVDLTGKPKISKGDPPMIGGICLLGGLFAIIYSIIVIVMYIDQRQELDFDQYLVLNSDESRYDQHQVLNNEQMEIEKPHLPVDGDVTLGECKILAESIKQKKWDKLKYSNNDTVEAHVSFHGVFNKTKYRECLITICDHGRAHCDGYCTMIVVGKNKRKEEFVLRKILEWTDGIKLVGILQLRNEMNVPVLCVSRYFQGESTYCSAQYLSEGIEVESKGFTIEYTDPHGCGDWVHEKLIEQKENEKLKIHKELTVDVKIILERLIPDGQEKDENEFECDLEDAKKQKETKVRYYFIANGNQVSLKRKEIEVINY